MDNNNIVTDKSLNSLPKMVPDKNDNLKIQNVDDVPMMTQVQASDSNISMPEMIPVNEEVTSFPTSTINSVDSVNQGVAMEMAQSSVNEVIPTMVPLDSVNQGVSNSVDTVNSYDTTVNNVQMNSNLDGNITNLSSQGVNNTVNAVNSLDTSINNVGLNQNIDVNTTSLPVQNINNFVDPLTVDSSPLTNSTDIVSNENHTSLQDVQPRTIFATDASYSDESVHAKVAENTQIDKKSNTTEVEYKPLSKIKIFGIIFLFSLLIGFVIFLPDITTYVEKFLSGEKDVVYEKITTGKLLCTYETTTIDTTINYEITFSFSNNKLEKLKYVTISRVDPSEDSGTMDKLISNCLLLKQETESIPGVSIRCEDDPSILTLTQNFNFEELDKEKLTSAYDEAGGTSPEYEFGQEMDGIEKNMNAIGYTCQREK